MRFGTRMMRTDLGHRSNRVLPARAHENITSMPSSETVLYLFSTAVWRPYLHFTSPLLSTPPNAGPAELPSLLLSFLFATG